MKILIIHSFGLGDMIMFTPALDLIVSNHPQAKIDLLAFKPYTMAPVAHHEAVNKIFYARLNLRSILSMAMTLRKKSYDISFFTSGVKYHKCFIFHLLVNARKKIVEYTSWHLPFPSFIALKRLKDCHRVDNNLNIAAVFCPTGKKTKRATRYFFSKKMSHKRTQTVGIHMGSDKKFAEKRWPVKQYISLMKLILAKTSLRIVVFAGPDEKEEMVAVQKNFDNKQVVLFNDISLDKTAQAIATCSYFICSDSGFGHLAGCFNAQILLIKTRNNKTNINVTRVYTKKLTLIDLSTKKSTAEQSTLVWQHLMPLLKKDNL